MSENMTAASPLNFDGINLAKAGVHRASGESAIMFLDLSFR